MGTETTNLEFRYDDRSHGNSGMVHLAYSIVPTEEADKPQAANLSVTIDPNMDPIAEYGEGVWDRVTADPLGVCEDLKRKFSDGHAFYKDSKSRLELDAALLVTVRAIESGAPFEYLNLLQAELIEAVSAFESARVSWEDYIEAKLAAQNVKSTKKTTNQKLENERNEQAYLRQASMDYVPPGGYF